MDRPVSQSEVQPWHRLGGMEHICELRKSSMVLYSILVSILRTIYSNNKGRVFGCTDAIWLPDPQKTGIWIDTELRWEDTRPDFTPAIYACLGEIQYEPTPLMSAGGEVFISNDGEYSYDRIASCTASLVHVCDRAGAACCLADNTEQYLSSLQAQLRNQYCFDKFEVAGRVPRQKKETQQAEGKGKYLSVVSLRMSHIDSWTVKTEAPVLKAVNMVDSSDGRASVAGDEIALSSGQVEIEFGNMSTATHTSSRTKGLAPKEK